MRGDSHLRRPWGEHATASMDAADALASPRQQPFVCGGWDAEAVERVAIELERSFVHGLVNQRGPKRVDHRAGTTSFTVTYNGIACQVIVAPLPADFTIPTSEQ